MISFEIVALRWWYTAFGASGFFEHFELNWKFIWEEGKTRTEEKLKTLSLPPRLERLEHNYWTHTLPNCRLPMSQSFVFLFLHLMTSRFNTNCHVPNDDGEHWITLVTERAHRTNIDDKCCWKHWATTIFLFNFLLSDYIHSINHKWYLTVYTD